MSSSTFNLPSPTLNSPSNLQNFLRAATPFIRPKPIQKIEDQNAIPVIEYFKMEDLWKCYEKASAYGIGTKVILDNGEVVTNYYTPHISALQIYTKKSSSSSKPNKKDESVGVEFHTKSLGGYSIDSENRLISSSNNSRNSNSADSSADNESSEVMKGDLYMEHFDHEPANMKMPMFYTITGLSEDFSGVMNFNSTDLSPESWMAVTWLPIYAIPNRPDDKDLRSCFLTFHLLSPSSQETVVIDEDKDWKSAIDRVDRLESLEIGGRFKKGRGNSSRICLRPFGVAKYKPNGEVWTNEGSIDWAKLNKAVNGAAESWLKQQNAEHHNFDFCNCHFPLEY